MARLTYRNRLDDPVTIDLGKGRISLGRSPGNDIVLNHRSISRHHAELFSDETGRYQVLDLGSKNGVLLNGRRIGVRATLADGDRIKLGERELVYSAAAEPASPPGPGRTGTMMVPVEDILHTLGRGDGPPTSTADSAAQSARLKRLSAVINRTALALISNRPLPELLELVLDLVFDALPVQRGCLMLLEAAGDAADEDPAFRDVISRRCDNGSGTDGFSPSRTILKEVIGRRVSILTLDALGDERFDAAQSVVTQGIRSAVCVPLWSRTEVIGVVYADSLNPLNHLGREELELLTFIANLAAVKIENARLLEQSLEKQRLEEELKLAAGIQGRLLPAGDPQLPGYEVHGYNRQCHDVGGDYFDFIERPGGRLGVSVGDVAGKGIGASLLMANLQACLHVLSAAGLDLTGIMGRLNEHFCRHSAKNKFITFFNAEIDAAEHRLRFSNAGHNPPLLLRAAGGEAQRLSDGGPVLGVIPGVAYTATEKTLEPGDLILLYTDGVTETVNPDGEEFGIERLSGFLASVRGLEPADLLDSLVEELARFRGPDATPGDDTTLVLIRRAGG